MKPFGEAVPEGVVIRGRRAFLLSDELKTATEGMKLDFFSIGLPLGEATARGFRPSFALLDLMKSSQNALVIADDAEWMFTCQRDIFEENVISDFSTSEPFLVQTRSSEVLGLGSWFSKGRRRFVKPMLDRGDFLRRERKGKR